LVLRGLGGGRGIFWRTIAHTLLGDQWPSIQQFKIETVQLTDTQKITQIENYYFDLSAMIAAHEQGQLPPVIVHRDISELAFPYEIGWLHFDNATNNETHAPGLGQALHYKAPGIICSLYIYDRGLPNIPDDIIDHLVRKEFDSAVQEIATTQSTFTPWPDQPSRRDCLERYYVSVIGKGSLLWLTTSRGRFIRGRATWFRDQFIDRVVTNFVDTVVAGIKSAAWLHTVAPDRARRPYKRGVHMRKRLPPRVVKNAVLRGDGVFNVMNITDIRLPGPWCWHGEDIEQPDAKGVIFRAYRRSGGLDIAYLLVADVTTDPTEPDISDLIAADVPELDQRLEAGIRDQFETQSTTLTRWMSSRLNEDRGQRALLTAYIITDSGKDRQMMAVRMKIHGRKMIQCRKIKGIERDGGRHSCFSPQASKM
jgi:hypothetical protein